MEQTIEQKLQAVEQQIYITYLQINSLVKMLSESQVIDPEKLLANMDELNKSLYEAAQTGDEDAPSAE